MPLDLPLHWEWIVPGSKREKSAKAEEAGKLCFLHCGFTCNPYLPIFEEASKFLIVRIADMDSFQPTSDKKTNSILFLSQGLWLSDPGTLLYFDAGSSQELEGRDKIPFLNLHF